MARQRRPVEHRRWMIRSFALTALHHHQSLLGRIGFLVLSPQLDSLFGGSEKLLTWTIAGLATWLGWVVTLLIAEWWLERDVSAAYRARLSGAGQRVAPAQSLS